jgi:Major tropism determinant N-terminal domain
MADIQHKRTTKANWTSLNPVLADGEMGIETDTKMFKFGDGVTPWNTLGYAAASGGNVDGGTPDSVYGGTTAVDGGGI